MSLFISAVGERQVGRPPVAAAGVGEGGLLGVPGAGGGGAIKDEAVGEAEGVGEWVSGGGPPP